MKLTKKTNRIMFNLNAILIIGVGFALPASEPLVSTANGCLDIGGDLG